MIYTIIIMTAFSILGASQDASRINHGVHPNHARNLAVVLAQLLICMWLFSPYVVGCIFLVPLVFDNCLNMFRKLPITYQPQNPKSVIDRLENWAFGKHAWLLSNLLYLILFIAGIIVNIIYHK